MKKIISIFRVLINRVKFLCLKIKGANVSCAGRCTSRLDNEYRIAKNGTLSIGYHFASLKRCRFLVENGTLTIGDNVGLNTNCIIACHGSIKIGNNVEFGPNVCVYDHDHDFRAEGGLKAKKFVIAPVVIGEGTWIGANVIILKGTKIGRNCVIGAGSVVSGDIPDNSIYTQKLFPSIRPTK